MFLHHHGIYHSRTCGVYFLSLYIALESPLKIPNPQSYRNPSFQRHSTCSLASHAVQFLAQSRARQGIFDWVVVLLIS